MGADVRTMAQLPGDVAGAFTSALNTPAMIAVGRRRGDLRVAVRGAAADGALVRFPVH
jgi:hypothetical protein